MKVLSNHSYVTGSMNLSLGGKPVETLTWPQPGQIFEVTGPTWIGGWGGAGSSAWKDEAEPKVGAKVRLISRGNPATPAVWEILD